MYYATKKTLNAWLSDKTKWKGASKYNLELLRDAKDAEGKLKTIIIATYVLLRNTNMRSINAMLVSAKKQKDLMSMVVYNLKKYRVDEKWYKAIKREIGRIEARYQWVKNIIDEDVKLTHLYPYFRANGYEDLYSIRSGRDGKDEIEQGIAELEEKIERWNKRHKDEVDEYVASIQDEVDRVNAYRENIKQKEKDEKAAARAARKAENDEIKQMRKYAAEHRKEERKANKVYEFYC